MRVKTLSHIVKAVSKMSPLLFWILAVVCCVMEIAALLDPHLPEIRVALADFSLLLLPYLFIKPKLRWAVWVPVALVAVYALISHWYYAVYGDIVPLSSILVARNAGVFALEGARGVMGWYDAWFVVPPLALLVLWVAWRKRIAGGRPFAAKTRIVVASVVLMMVIGNQIYGFMCYKRESSKIDREVTIGSFYAQMRSMALRTAHVGVYGWLLYFGHELYLLASPDLKLTPVQTAEVERFIAGKRQQLGHVPSSGSLLDSLKQRNGSKNLIFIIVESLNSAAVNTVIEGAAITPHLSALLRSDSVVYFRRMRPQVRDGRSSDGQLIYNTGLLPLVSEPTVARYAHADYPSLAKALRRYSFEVIGEERSVWNHNITSVSYGFDTNYDNSDHGERDFAKVDSTLFEFAIQKMSDVLGPVYCEIATIAMHDPYDSPCGATTEISRFKSMGEAERNYLERVRRFDRQLSHFLDRLKAEGLYDESVIVIASDHDARGVDVAKMGSDIVFIVLNAGLDIRSDAVIGQIDVFPTLLQIMGRTDYRWPGAGRGLVGRASDNAAKDGYGNLYGSPSDSLAAQLGYEWEMSRLLIKSRYFAY